MESGTPPGALPNPGFELNQRWLHLQTLNRRPSPNSGGSMTSS
jgi:hypothetical protein